MTSLVLNTQNSTPFNTNSISVIATPTVQTMSSKEIAELTGKDHSHVLRDIRSMLEQLQNPNLDSKDYQVVLAPNGMTAEILLNKDLSVCLVSGYNVQLRMAIIRRWNELEQQVFMMNRPSYMIEDDELRALKWIEERKEKKLIENQLFEATKVIEIQAPKAEIFDAVLDKSRTYSIREFAQRTGVKEKEVKKWLAEKLWLTGTHSKSYRPAARANVGNFMRMVKQGKTYTDKWGVPHHNEIIEFTQDGFNEAVRKMVKSGMMKPLATEVVEADNYQLQA